MRVIKKYANRRMYDYATRSIITLEDIAEMVKDGEDIKVIDNTTGEDITAEVLSKALAVVSKENKSQETVEMLSAVLKGTLNNVKNTLEQVVYAALGLASITRESVEKFFNDLEQKGINLNSSPYKEIKEFLSKAINETEKVRSTISSIIDMIDDSSKIKKIEDKIDDLKKLIESEKQGKKNG